MNRKNGAGFTLIELVIVLAILAALAAIAVPRLANLTDRVGLVDVQRQARALKTRDQINIASCGSNGLECINIEATGYGENGVCRTAAREFFLDKGNNDWRNRYGIVTMASSRETESERQEKLNEIINDDSEDVTEEAALYTVTRWLDSENTTSYPPEVPCIIYKK